MCEAQVEWGVNERGKPDSHGKTREIALIHLFGRVVRISHHFPEIMDLVRPLQ